MSRKAVSCLIDNGIKSAGSIDDPVRSASSATLAAAIATLTADGASPTEAHATAVASAWTTLLAGLGAIPSRSDVVVSWDTSAVVTRSTLRSAIRALSDAAMGLDGLTGS